jgi:hypothetical protein
MNMWQKWYALSLAQRDALIKKHGSEFNAAYALYGDASPLHDVFGSRA